MTANPFEVLPANLFNLFSTQGYSTLQRHYMALLLRLYAIAEFNRYGLSREVVIAEIVDYLKNEDAERAVVAEMQADAETKLESVAGQASPQDYATYLSAFKTS